MYFLRQVALLLGFGLLCFDPTEEPGLCVASACLVHLFFTGAFTFYLLESKSCKAVKPNFNNQPKSTTKDIFNLTNST